MDHHPKVSQACVRLEALDTLEAILEAIPTMDIQAVRLECTRIQGVTHHQACQCTGQVPLRLVLTGQLFSR